MPTMPCYSYLSKNLSIFGNFRKFMDSKIILLLAFIGSGVLANPGTVYVRNLKHEKQNCAQVFHTYGASESFDASVAHAVHSMTLDDLKKFDPHATVDNFVPTIQLDLRAEQAILPYALDLKPKNTGNFSTDGMKVLDMVLSHMDEKHWGIVGFGALEKVVHAFHMQEMWVHVHHEFETLGAEISSPNPEFCQCAMDLENSGIIKILRFIAMALREPGLVYGDKSFSSRNSNQPINGYPVRYQFGYPINFSKADIMKKGDDTEGKDLFVHEFSETMPPLKDAAAWAAWKNDFEMTQQHHRDVAMFLYCAIARAHISNI